MNYPLDQSMRELRTLLADLGTGGGLISPSVYDTAQVLRLCPPSEGVELGLDWLVEQQQPDGGWGNSEAPYSRTVPTLAALMALYPYCQDHPSRSIIDNGVTFLRHQAAIWTKINIDVLPIATEMILPTLLEQAQEMGLTLDLEPYSALYALRKHKYKQVAAKKPVAGSAPTYSWEVWGKEADPPLLDYSGGIGHSPAATAAWLRKAEKCPELAQACNVARQYLKKAEQATGTGIPGIVPNVWPITGFEYAYGLYALLITDLMEHPILHNEIETILNELSIVMERGNGVSFGEYFVADMDDTSLALAALQAAGRKVDPDVVLQFKNGSHFCTFPHELNPSVFTNAHALYALSRLGIRDTDTENFLLERQDADGRWLADKLHNSWLYTTLEVIVALHALGYTQQIKRAAEVLIENQKADGGWSSGNKSTRAETSYVVIALQILRKDGMLSEQGIYALQCGFKWLYHTSAPAMKYDEMLWLGKELYAPYRVDRIYELSALLFASEELPYQ